MKKIAAWKAFLLGSILFGMSYGLVWVARRVAPDAFASLPWLGQVGLQSLVVLGCWLLGKIVFKGRSAAYGITWPSGVSRLQIAGPAMLLGGLVSVFILASGAAGMSIAQEYGFLKYLFFVWIFSSVMEELFLRGFLHSVIATPTPTEPRLFRPTSATTATALLFGCMHITVLAKSDATTTVIIMLATTALGFVVGWLREKSQSVLPAIVGHMFFNIGAFLGGIVSVVIFGVTTAK